MGESPEKGLPLLDRVVCMGAGPLLGWLPPRVQRDIVIDDDGQGYDRATLLSKSSRAFGGLTTLYAVGAGVGKLFGVDIDPTHADYLIWGSAAIGLDTIARELFRGAAIAYHGTSAAGDIWGSPTASLIDRMIHPGAYRIAQSSVRPE